MLVLTRKVGETIRIGDDIVVTVLEMRRGQVRIGIDAPRQMRIVRADARSEVETAALAGAVWSTDRQGVDF